MSSSAILEEISRSVPAFTALRRDIHANPELGYGETRTAAIVAEKLRAWGYEVETGIGGTGVVGRLRHSDGTRSIGLRADMDALPIPEGTSLLWASRNPGLMHACGHDGHTTILLAAAEYLAATRRFNGTLNLIFQPSEEGVGKPGTEHARISGAVAMMEDGLFTRFPCDHIFALHNGPGLPETMALASPGLFMAASGTVEILLQGVGGHGSMPHRSRDPVVAAAAIVMALQTICSRNLDPDEFGVVTVGVLRAGVVGNVIPDTAKLVLNVRAKSSATHDLLDQRIEEIVRAQAIAFGVTAQIDILRPYPVLENDANATRIMQEVLTDVLGEGNVILSLPKGVSGSEDFAWMLQKRPGCYFILGNGVEGANGIACHNPGYDFNDAAIPVGASIWARLVESYLK